MTHPIDTSAAAILAGILPQAWSLLTEAVATRRGPFHTPTIATIGTDGAPEVRTVVLRAAEADHWLLRFHTDRRSPKISSLQARPQIALHGYDAGLKVQLRLTGLAHLHVDDAVADAAWKQSQPISRVCYAQGVAPGSPLARPDLPAIAAGACEDVGRRNFVAVVIAVGSLEWLHLAASGHRRARFVRTADGTISSQWLAP